MKLLALVLSSFLTLHSSFSAPPNVIYLMVDELGYHEPALMGGKNIVDELTYYRPAPVVSAPTPANIQEVQTPKEPLENKNNNADSPKKESTKNNKPKN